MSYQVVFLSGRSVPCEHVTMFQKKKRMKAVVLLIKDNRGDNENFAYPNLKTMKISIEG